MRGADGVITGERDRFPGPGANLHSISRDARGLDEDVLKAVELPR